jgi:hypothetical protein
MDSIDSKIITKPIYQNKTVTSTPTPPPVPPQMYKNDEKILNTVNSILNNTLNKSNIINSNISNSNISNSNSLAKSIIKSKVEEDTNKEGNTNEKDDKTELTLQDISVNLRLISKIEVGNKLSLNEKYINIDNTYFQSVTRWIRGLNRNNNIYFINSILSRAFQLNDLILLEKQVDYYQTIFRLTTDLKNSISGLSNLKQTYCNDKLIQSELDVIIENIRNKIESNYKKLDFSQ